MSLLGRLLESRAVMSAKWLPPSNSDGYGVDSGEYVTERSALRLVTVYACVRLLADSIASLPMDVYRKRDGIPEEVRPTPALIRQPSNDLTPFEWVFQTVTSLALRGDSYHLIIGRDPMEFATEAMPLHPDLVMVEADSDTGKPIYKVEGARVPTANVIHIRRFSLPGCLTGLSPIDQARQGIGLSLAAERYGSRWFGDSAHPSAILSTEAHLTDTQVRENQQRWLDSQGGRRHPAVLSGMKYQQISITPEESQFLQTRKFQNAEIAKLYGIPPHMIGETDRVTSWGTGIEQQSIGFVRYTLRPWLSCIEAALSAQLPRGQFVRFNVEALLRGDTKNRYESYVAARNAGWLSVNEIRSLEDRPAIPNGDDFIQPLNMGPLGSDPLAAKGEPTQEDDPDAA